MMHRTFSFLAAALLAVLVAVPNVATGQAAAPSRAEVMRKAAEPRSFDIGYFA